MKKERIIALEPIKVERATVFLEGDSDLVLNKMNARAIRKQVTKQKNERTTDEAPNFWEDIITSVHWRDTLNMKDTYKEATEEALRDLLQNNAPCITGFGLKKSFCQAVVRNEIDTYATKFDNAVNVIDRLEPITFTEHFVDEMLMSPKKGSPVLVHLNRFSGWRSQVHIIYTENVYSLQQIVNIINLAGFGLGIGSGRSSGYGRYHVVDVK